MVLWRSRLRRVLIFVFVLVALSLNANGLLSQSQIESPNAPRITSIELPKGKRVGAPGVINWIPADGSDQFGLIGYEDKDGDIVKVTFKTVEARADGGFAGAAFSFDPQIPVNEQGKQPEKGAFDFRIFTAMTQDVTMRVTLEDKKGNVSQPKEFSFKAVGPEPVISRIEFPKEISIGQLQDLKIGFIEREKDLTRVEFQLADAGKTTTCQRVRQEGGREVTESLVGIVDVSETAFGQQEGQLVFKVSCPNAQALLLKVALFDARGNRNKTFDPKMPPERQKDALRQEDTFDFIAGRKLAEDLFFLDQLGGFGEALGRFNSPQGLAVDSQGRIYVADTANNRIQIFDPERLKTGDKRPLFVFGSFCLLREGCSDPDGGGPLLPGESHFNGPTDIAVDVDGSFYVVDNGNHGIQKFTVASSCPAPSKPVVSGICFVTRWGSLGTASGAFNAPRGIAVDAKNKFVYVADTNNHRVQKFDTNGSFRLAWGSQCTLLSQPPVGCRDPDGPERPLQLGDGQFNAPDAVAVDGDGNVYVTEAENHRVQKFSGTNGNFLLKWGRLGKTAIGQFDTPTGITIDNQRNVLVVDQNNDRIQKFDAEGRPLDQWGGGGKTEGRFDTPQDIAVDSAGSIYVVELLNHRVQKFGLLR